MADQEKVDEELETEETGEETEEKSDAMKELEKEVKGIIKDDYKEDEEEDEDPEKKEETPPDDSEEDDKDKQAEEDKDEKDSIPNALKERAVKVDLSLDEIDTYSDIAMLEKYVALKEEIQAGKSEEGGTSAEEEGERFDKALAEVFDFKEDEVDEDGEKWDSELVERFGKMKELFVGMAKSSADQGKLLEELQSSGYSGNDFLNSEITKLGKPYEELFGKDGSISEDQQKSRDKVSRYVDMITDEAKDSGDELSPEEAFKRAINGLHSDKVVKEKGKTVAKKAKERSKRAINAPRGDDGTFLKEGEQEPVEAEDKAIKALDEKYG